MTYFDKILKVLAGVAVGAVLASCGEKAAPPADPEAHHCTRVAMRLTRDVGSITVIEAKSWTFEDVQNVRVRFAYPETASNAAIYGNVLCSYPFPVDIRGDKDRQPQLQSVYFQGRYLSKNELLLLNIGLRGVRPDLKIK